MVLDLVKLQPLPYVTVDKGYAIVINNPMGYSNLTIMFSLMKFATAPPVALRSGTTSYHLVKYSVTIKIHMYPRDGGLTSPTRSSTQMWKDHRVTMLRKFYG